MELLKELRKKKGLLQKDVAEHLGIDRTTYVKYENGVSEPDFKTLKKIANLFDVSTDDLLGNEKKPPAKATVTDDDIKVALFGGDGEVTDEMWEEVKSFAEYVKHKKINDN